MAISWRRVAQRRARPCAFGEPLATGTVGTKLSQAGGHPTPLAFCIRQPYSELILRGIKTAELRSRAMTIVGRRFYLYAAKAKAPVLI